MPITLLGNVENEGSRQNKMKIVQRKKNLQKRIIFEWKDKTKKYKLFANKRLVVVKTKIHFKNFFAFSKCPPLSCSKTNERCTKKIQLRIYLISGIVPLIIRNLWIVFFQAKEWAIILLNELHLLRGGIVLHLMLNSDINDALSSLQNVILLIVKF